MITLLRGTRRAWCLPAMSPITEGGFQTTSAPAPQPAAPRAASNRHAAGRDRQGNVQDLRMQDVPQLSTASLSTGRGGTSTEGCSQVRSWWDECRPFVGAVSTLPAGHTVLGNDHEQRRRSRSSCIDFGSAPPTMRVVRFRVLKDGR